MKNERDYRDDESMGLNAENDNVDNVLDVDSDNMGIDSGNQGEQQTMETAEATKDGLQEELQVSEQNRKETPKQVNPDLESALQKLSTYEYNGKPLTEIAARWVDVFGAPADGETMSYYRRMCVNLRYICNNMPAVLIACLPSFNLEQEERWKIVRDCCKYVLKDKLPVDFYKFLIRNGFKKKVEREDEIAFKDKLDFSAKIEDEPKFPKFPPVFDIFQSTSPEDFWVAQTYVVEACLSTLFTGLKSTFLDGVETTTTFHGAIFAPQSVGKSFADKTVKILTQHLRDRDRKIDDMKIAEQRKLKALKAAGVKIKADEIDMNNYPKRIMPQVTSVTNMAELQYDAQGMHQFHFDTELDMSLYNREKNKWNTLYRKNWDNAEYSQGFKSELSFSGGINLHINVLQCGTPNQVRRYYDNPENGLITRVHFCEIRNQEFTPFHIIQSPTEEQMAYIKKVIEFSDKLTYADDEFMVAKDRTDITQDLMFLEKPIKDFWDRTLKQAAATANNGLDTLRRREGMKMWRLAMCCWGAYLGQLNDKRRKLITEFVLWRAEQDLKTSLALFGEQIQALHGQPSLYYAPLYTMLKGEFTVDEVEEAAGTLNFDTPSKNIISRWIKRGAIEKLGKKKYRKILKVCAKGN